MRCWLKANVAAVYAIKAYGRVFYHRSFQLFTTVVDEYILLGYYTASLE
jgi:hypothetical protein